MQKWIMTILYSSSIKSGSAALVSFKLPSPHPSFNQILEKYARKYEFPRENLGFIVSPLLEDEELTRFV